MKKWGIIAAVIWLGFGILLGIGYWASTWHLGRWQLLNWNAVAGFATWVLAGGVFLTWLQIREARKSTQAQIAVTLFDELRHPLTVDMLRRIYNYPFDLSSPAAVRDLNQYEQANIEYILDRLDFLGILVANGIVDKELAIYAYAGAPALRCWYRLHKFIKIRRKQRGTYIDNFEGFARECLDYFSKRQIQVKFFQPGEENRGKCLNTELQKPELHPRNLKEIKRDWKKSKAG